MIEAQTVAELDDSLGLRVNALGAKKGPFYVLVGARMPAVLVECGFLSNRDRGARLAAPALPGSNSPTGSPPRWSIISMPMLAVGNL